MPTTTNDNTGTRTWTTSRWLEVKFLNLINSSDDVDRVSVICDREAAETVVDITLNAHNWAWLTRAQAIELRDALNVIIQDTTPGQ